MPSPPRTYLYEHHRPTFRRSKERLARAGSDHRLISPLTRCEMGILEKYRTSPRWRWSQPQSTITLSFVQNTGCPTSEWATTHSESAKPDPRFGSRCEVRTSVGRTGILPPRVSPMGLRTKPIKVTQANTSGTSHQIKTPMSGLPTTRRKCANSTLRGTGPSPQYRPGSGVGFPSDCSSPRGHFTRTSNSKYPSCF